MEINNQHVMVIVSIYFIKKKTSVLLKRKTRQVVPPALSFDQLGNLKYPTEKSPEKRPLKQNSNGCCCCYSSMKIKQNFFCYTHM